MAQIVSDNFNGTASQTLQVYNPAWVKTANTPGDMVITAAGAVMNAGGATGGYYRSDASPPSADYSVSADITTGTSILGVTLRTQTNAATFYQGRFSGTTLELYRFTNGSGSLLANFSTGAASGSTFNLKVEVEGSSLRAYLDRATTPAISRTDANISSAGFAGIRSGVGTGSIDNFSADTLEVAQPVQLTINHIESGEATSANGNVAVLATVMHTEPGESHSIAAEMAVRFLANHSETGETHSISGRVDVLASANWTEGNETTSAAIQVGGGVSLAVNHVESNETHVIAALNSVFAAISNFEAGDSHSIVVQVVGGEIGDIDALLVPPRQTVVFEGSRRVVAFEGGQRVVSFEGSKRLVEFQ